MVLGILAQIAQLARLLDRLRKLRAQLALHLLELAAQPLPCGPRHHRQIHVRLLADAGEHLPRALLARMLHGFDRLGESDAIRQLEPREEEAVARAPLAQQDREAESHGLGTGPAAQPALE